MCGIVGMLSQNPVIADIYGSLIMLQHRGQDAAGIATYDGEMFHLKKGTGLAKDVILPQEAERLKGNVGLGHVRYPTAGSYNAAEAQPFYVNSPFGITLVHNGNLTNYNELKKAVNKNDIRHLNTRSDSELLLNVLAEELLRLKKTTLKPADVFKAVQQVYKRVQGGYAVIANIGEHGLLAFRDKYGNRPLIFGKRENGLQTEYMVASESVALDAHGFEVIDDVQPGEAVYIDLDYKVHRKKCTTEKRAHCVFEYVYLARPDSLIDKVSVYKARLRMGQYIAKDIKKANLPIDVVIPVPDSSRSSALSIAHKLGVRYREGLVKNRYIGRTFIMPGQSIRQQSVRRKLNPIKLELRKKNVLLVDDSIVRGNTSRQIVDMVREAGAKKVYFASCSPPLRHPCVYGIDMPSKKEFVANDLTVEETRKVIGADALFYLKQKDLFRAVHEGNKDIKNVCMACMDGKYPTGKVTEAVLRHAEETRCDTSKEKVRPEDQLVLM